MNIIVVGDSISQGAFDTERGGWVARLKTYQLGRIVKTNWAKGGEIHNISVSGDTSNEVKSRVLNEVDARLWEDDLILLAVGINDAARKPDNSFWVDIEVCRTNIISIIHQLHNVKLKVVVCGLTRVAESFQRRKKAWHDNYVWYNKDIEQYDSVIKNICSEEKVLYIQLDDIFLNDPTKYLADGIHPNAEGHRLIFERIKKVLEEDGVL